MGSNTIQFSSLTQWSKEHIQNIFESPSDEESMRAVEATFSKEVDATFNGQKITLEGVKQSVRSIRKNSGSGGLRIQWYQTVEAPCDPTNSEGSFGGTYFIEGIRRRVPGDKESTAFTRQKTVIVRIKSQGLDSVTDDRQIVNLAFVAADVPDHLEKISRH